MTKKREIFAAPAAGFTMAPAHPGEVLQEEIAARGLTTHALALKLRVPANRLTEIIAGKRGVSPDTALRLSRSLGPGAAFWLNLQSQYDLAMAEKRLGAKIRAEVEAAQGKGAEIEAARDDRLLGLRCSGRNATLLLRLRVHHARALQRKYLRPENLRGGDVDPGGVG